MLLRNLGRLAFAATAALLPFTSADDSKSKDDDKGQSTFVSPDGKIAFALTIADNHDTDVYFSLRVPYDVSWGAVGLGSDDMDGALFLVLYKNRESTSVTFSPRLAYGHYEPRHFKEMEVDILPGTGIYGDYYMFTGLCKKHCRSWPGGNSGKGWIDVGSPNEKAIFAYGPKMNYGSNSASASLPFHKGYGSFTIDMKRTHGSNSSSLSLSSSSRSVGTELVTPTQTKKNWMTPLHGVFMILSIVFLMPVGVILLRSGGLAKWHAINQTIALMGVFVGFGIGIANSFLYQRSRSFDSAHQIIGFVVTGFLLGQFGLGVLHHLKFKKTQAPTKFGKIHLWLGRVILFLGTLNAFMGFTLALNRRYGMVLAALIIFICFAGLFMIFSRRYIDKRRRGPGFAGPLQGYNPGPWRQQQHPPPHAPWRQQPPEPHHTAYPSDPPPGYEASSSNANLRPVSPWRSGRKDDDDAELNLGSEQRPRDFT